MGGSEGLERQISGTTRTASKRLAAARSDNEERLNFIQRTALERINDLVLVRFIACMTKDGSIAIFA